MSFGKWPEDSTAKNTWIIALNKKSILMALEEEVDSASKPEKYLNF